LHDGVLFKKRYDGDPLRHLGPHEASEMIREVHIGECGSTRERKSYTNAATDGLLLAHHEERHSRICEKIP